MTEAKKIRMAGKPIQITNGEWWFCGCFIQCQRHPCLQFYYRVFKDNEEQSEVGCFKDYKDAKKACIENKVENYKFGYKSFL